MTQDEALERIKWSPWRIENGEVCWNPGKEWRKLHKDEYHCFTMRSSILERLRKDFIASQKTSKKSLEIQLASLLLPLPYVLSESDIAFIEKITSQKIRMKGELEEADSKNANAFRE